MTSCYYALLPILKSRFLSRVLQLLIAAIYLTSSGGKLLDFSRTSLKVNEYTSSLGFETGHTETDILAILLIALEMSIGLLFLQRIVPKCIQKLSISILILFTALTFYIAAQGTISDCGCFGEILPLTPWESFCKNIFILGVSLILYYLYKPNHQKSRKTNKPITLSVSAASLALVLTVSIYLQPLKDFSHNKKGDTIAQTSDNIRFPVSIETYRNIPKSKETNNIESLIYNSKDSLTVFVYNGNNNEFNLDTQEIKQILSSSPTASKTLLLSSDEISVNEDIEFDHKGLADSNFLKDLIPGKMGIVIVKKGVIIGKKQKTFIGRQRLH